MSSCKITAASGKRLGGALSFGQGTIGWVLDKDAGYFLRWFVSLSMVDEDEAYWCLACREVLLLWLGVPAGKSQARRGMKASCAVTASYASYRKEFFRDTP